MCPSNPASHRYLGLVQQARRLVCTVAYRMMAVHASGHAHCQSSPMLRHINRRATACTAGQRREVGLEGWETYDTVVLLAQVCRPPHCALST
jgi:hypothetical protein